MKYVPLISIVTFASAFSACDTYPQLILTQSDVDPVERGLNEDDAKAGESSRFNLSDTSMTSDEGKEASFVANPCADVECEARASCLVDEESGEATCRLDSCATLECDVVKEACTVDEEGGAYCRDISCSADTECEAGVETCDLETGTCKGNICEERSVSCDGSELLACNSNGSQESVLFACGSGRPAEFMSACIAGDARESAGCTCEDDWDCPQFSTCEATTRDDLLAPENQVSLGLCQGTGTQPTCSLPPREFSSDTTGIEIQWGSPELGEIAGIVLSGGTDENVYARRFPSAAVREGKPLTPYPQDIQVVMTPTVANLTDDNGDGRIDERDDPEIIFIAMTENSRLINSNKPNNINFKKAGMLRAIRGGGSKKGDDLFAWCSESEFWHVEDGYSENSDEHCIGQPQSGEADDNPPIDSTAGVAVGDLDYDGIPEIVAVGDQNEVLIFNNKGRLLLSSNDPIAEGGANTVATLAGDNPQPSIANIDQQGLVEIVVGPTVFQLKQTVDEDDVVSLAFGPYFIGGAQNGRNSQGPIPCIANIDESPELEIIAGGSIYHLPDAGDELDQTSCSGTDWCDQNLVLILQAKDTKDTVDTADDSEIADGFCAVADVLPANELLDPSPENPLDGKPEVILVSEGNLIIYSPRDGEQKRFIDLETSYLDTNDSGEVKLDYGGAPNIDDFDGDGFPEIGTAVALAYRVVDLQPSSDNCPAFYDGNLTSTGAPQFLDPDDSSSQLVVDAAGTPLERLQSSTECRQDSECEEGLGCNTVTNRCVCLQNGWWSQTEDDSSRVTGSSVFDFNGDGAAEVVYNDECKFRIYDGASGTPLVQKWSESRTRVEYPIVADVDSDGNAEIVFATTTESEFCSQGGSLIEGGTTANSKFNAGIEVWGDTDDIWVPARRIWNQHAYHVTNITESGQVPALEPANTGPAPIGGEQSEYNSRNYNTYRSNPRNYGVAPDLFISGIQVATPAACGGGGTSIDIIATVKNIGDLLVGPDVKTAFEADFGAGFVPLVSSENVPYVLALGESLSPGREVRLTIVGYEPSFNGESEIPASIRVRADSENLESECNDVDYQTDNNSLTFAVVSEEKKPDLEVEILDVAGCPSSTVNVKVSNSGAAASQETQVALYFGSPNQGGVEQVRLDFDALSPGESETKSQTVTPPNGREVLVYAVVNPDGAQAECNDGNNEGSADELLRCDNIVIPR